VILNPRIPEIESFTAAKFILFVLLKGVTRTIQGKYLKIKINVAVLGAISLKSYLKSR